LRIRACVARPATAKCGGEKLHKGVCADCSFLEPEPPIGGEQLPFVKRWFFAFITIIFFFLNH